MKATIGLFMLACSMVYGQDQPQLRQWLHVGLRVDYFSLKFKDFEDLFTRQLRKLGDVEVVDSKTVHDVRLMVLVSETLTTQEYSRRPPPLRRWAIAVIASRPVDKDLQQEMIAASWLVVADEKDLESTCANLITKFDHEVLETDRKRIRFPEPPPDAPTVIVPLALSNEVKPTEKIPEALDKQAGGGVFRVGGGVNAPALLYKVEPEYTEKARQAKIQGTVIVYVEVAPDGHAVNPRVVRSLGWGLDEKAIECVRKWKFRPGYKDGKAVTVAATIEVNFRLL